MKNIYRITVLLLSLVIINSSSTLAQNRMIDVTNEHAELGRTFANRVWIISKVGILSLPFRQETQQGKEAEYIRLTYSDPISKWKFRSKVDEIISNHSEFKNAIGGWTDEDGSVMTFVVLNDDETDQRASCLVIYNESTGIAVFMIPVAAVWIWGFFKEDSKQGPVKRRSRMM